MGAFVHLIAEIVCLVGRGPRDRLDVFAGDAEVAELDVAQLRELTDGAVVGGDLRKLLADVHLLSPSVW